MNLKVVKPYYYGNKDFEVTEATEDGEPRLRVAIMMGGDQEAYARLFAAAPDMLKALDTILSYVNGGYVGDQLKDIEHVALTAIARAKGEES